MKRKSSLWLTNVRRAEGPRGEPKTKGVDLGKKVAEEIITLRANDGAAAAESCRPHTSPGVYVPYKTGL